MGRSQNTRAVILGGINSTSGRRKPTHVAVLRIHADRTPRRHAAVGVDVEAGLVRRLVVVATLRCVNGELVGILIVDTLDDVYATVCQLQSQRSVDCQFTNLATVGPVGRCAPERRPDGTAVWKVPRIHDPESTKIIERLRGQADLAQCEVRQ